MYVINDHIISLIQVIRTIIFVNTPWDAVDDCATFIEFFTLKIVAQ